MGRILLISQKDSSCKRLELVGNQGFYYYLMYWKGLLLLWCLYILQLYIQSGVALSHHEENNSKVPGKLGHFVLNSEYTVLCRFGAKSGYNCMDYNLVYTVAQLSFREYL